MCRAAMRSEHWRELSAAGGSALVLNDEHEWLYVDSACVCGWMDTAGRGQRLLAFQRPVRASCAALYPLCISVPNPTTTWHALHGP
jgi:hypothetical protein